MYKSYRYNDMPVPVKRRDENKKEAPKALREETEEIKERKMEQCEKPCEKTGGLFDNIETDDLVLLVVALVLLMDDCDDKLLLMAVAFVFLSDCF